ncbi:hypothetical protein OPV22_025504 [Ensete ventricosum]|uniref:Uncharacterized protein n=1 Tax=Ensete ventricosum TaxID=4639 RepID=A0AAV8P9N4_ENSVE|nr:hypothetical protein OPV22_025504 [Ensete ventricosum]
MVWFSCHYPSARLVPVFSSSLAPLYGAAVPLLDRSITLTPFGTYSCSHHTLDVGTQGVRKSCSWSGCYGLSIHQEHFAGPEETLGTLCERSDELKDPPQPFIAVAAMSDLIEIVQIMTTAIETWVSNHMMHDLRNNQMVRMTEHQEDVRGGVLLTNLQQRDALCCLQELLPSIQ